MKYEPASKARHDAALRLMQRVEAITKRTRVEPVPTQDEIDKAERRSREGEAPCALINQFEILALAAAYPSLKRVGNNGAHFVVSPSTHEKDLISGRAVRQLVELGLLAWVNEAHTAVVLTESGRGEE
jgi:hypothetical protein